jgi:hypothetical protein
MFRKTVTMSVLGVLAALGAVIPVGAQTRVNLTLGYLAPTGEDGRGERDVLVENRRVLTFDIGDLGGATVAADWLFPATERLDIAVGVGFSRSATRAAYTDLITFEGADIERDLKLQMVPITATARFLPRGRHHSVQPYVGVGVGTFVWQYSELGSFVDLTNLRMTRGNPARSGTSVGPVVLGGALVRVGRGRGLGGEVRYQRADGDLGSDFPVDRIDLGGFTYQLIFRFRF